MTAPFGPTVAIVVLFVCGVFLGACARVFAREAKYYLRERRYRREYEDKRKRDDFCLCGGMPRGDRQGDVIVLVKGCELRVLTQIGGEMNLHPGDTLHLTNNKAPGSKLTLTLNEKAPDHDLEERITH